MGNINKLGSPWPISDEALDKMAKQISDDVDKQIILQLKNLNKEFKKEQKE